MKFSRLTLAAAVSAALVLSSCTGADDTSPTSGTTPAGTAATQTEEATGTAGDAEETTDGGTAATGSTDAEGSTEDATGSSDGVAATEDGAGTTAAAPGDDASQTTEMTTDESVADLTVADAEKIAQTVLTARLDALKADQGKDFRTAMDKFSAGSAQEAALAAFRLRGVSGEHAEAGAEAPAEPNVLAISRKDDHKAQYFLVQTVPDGDGVPVLHLFGSSSGDHDDFHIVWEASQLPGTTIPSFDRRSVGSPTILGQDKGELEMAPRDLLKSVAAYTSWPQPDEVPDYRTHGYAPAVRRAAEAQADAVAAQATLREKNWLVSKDTRTLLFEDGSAMVFGTLLRDTKFAVRSGSILTPPDAFQVFAEDDSITDEAVMRTMVFLAMRMPAKEGDFKPEMLAAREQLVDAWGS